MEKEGVSFNQDRQVIKKALWLDRKWELKSIAEVESIHSYFSISFHMRASPPSI